MIELELDPLVDAAYLRRSHAPVVRTQSLLDNLFVDFDVQGDVVGIEILGWQE